MAIAQSENDTCDPTRHNMSPMEDHGVCVGSYGALQVGCVHYEPHHDPDDLATNVERANYVWRMQGYRAWTEYRNGGYLEYMR